jgi:hypothetical protein
MPRPLSSTQPPAPPSDDSTPACLVAASGMTRMSPASDPLPRNPLAAARPLHAPPLALRRDVTAPPPQTPSRRRRDAAWPRTSSPRNPRASCHITPCKLLINSAGSATPPSRGLTPPNFSGPRRRADPTERTGGRPARRRLGSLGRGRPGGRGSGPPGQARRARPWPPSAAIWSNKHSIRRAASLSQVTVAAGSRPPGPAAAVAGSPGASSRVSTVPRPRPRRPVRVKQCDESSACSVLPVDQVADSEALAGPAGPGQVAGRALPA